MSVPSPPRSLKITAHIADPALGQGNDHPTGASKSPLDEFAERRRGREKPHESIDDRGWDGRVAREALHQELIEATFDRADAYERLGDFDHALEWLDRAAALSGGLPPAYRPHRARLVRAAGRRPLPGAGRDVGLTEQGQVPRAV